MSKEFDLQLEDSIATVLQSGSDPHGQTLDPATRRQVTLATLTRRAAQAADEKAIRSDAARLVAESLDLAASGVATIDPKTGKLNFWYSHLQEAGPQGKDVTLPQDPCSSLAGFAIQAGRPIVCSNLSQEKRFSDRLLSEAGVQSALACPLDLETDARGAILVMSQEQRAFVAEDVLLLDAISGVAATSIARRRAETALTSQQRVRATILETLDALVIELTPAGRIVTFNRACQQLSGIAPQEVQDRPLWNAFLAPEEALSVQAAFDRLRDGDSPVSFESYLLTKQGQRCRIAWSFSMLKNDHGDTESLIGTGIDISERCQLREQLERTRTETNQARASLAELIKKIEAGNRDPQREETLPFAELSDGKFKERRKKPRRTYPYVQQIAPVFDDTLPPKENFQSVRCRDIAAGGFSYLSFTKPDYPRCVVAFGVAPSLTFLMARVVHCQPIEIEGKQFFTVGCQYIGRVEY